MNRRQRAILIDFAVVITITAVAVAAMLNFKDWVNHSEAMRAMGQLGQRVLRYREEHGSVPPESYIVRIKEKLEGHVRLGELRYRALWIGFEATPDEILGYTERNYHSILLSDGVIVLRLDGRVEWMGKKDFDAILAQQQSPEEIQMLRE